MIESQLEFEELKNTLEQDLLEKENLQTQIKRLDSENESLNKTVICVYLLTEFPQLKSRNCFCPKKMFFLFFTPKFS